MLLLLTGLGLACLPKIALGVLIVAFFLLIIWLIITKLVGKYWPEVASWAGWVILVIVLIIVLYLLVQFYQSGVGWIC